MSATTDDGSSAPDWGQLLVVLLSIAGLALAAAAIPAIGGLGLFDTAQPGPDGEPGADGSPADVGEGEQGADGSDADGDVGDGEMEGADGEGGEADGDVSDGEMGDADGDVSDNEIGEGDRGDGEIGEGDRGDGEIGEGDIEDANGEESDGEIGEADGDVDDGEISEADGDVGDGGVGEADGDDSDISEGEGGEADGDGEIGEGEGGEADGDGEIGEGEGGEADGDVGDSEIGEADGEGASGETDGSDESDDGEPLEGDADGGDHSPYEISLLESAVPGTEVPVIVTEDGEPVAGAEVTFNGESIGTTNSDGEVVGTVPYTTELRVGVTPADGSVQSVGQVGVTTAAVQSVASAEDNGGSEQTFETDGETDLELPSEGESGETVTLRATVGDGVPIPDGEVLVDGEPQGQTDANGEAAVTLPDADGTENVSVAVERGEIRAENVIAVRGLALEVTTWVPLPGRTVDLEIREGGEPVESATVTLDESVVVEETPGGSAAVPLPIANEATISVTDADGRTAETTVSGLYRNATLLGVGVAGILAALVGVGRRVGVTRGGLRSLLARTGGVFRRFLRTIQTLGSRTVDAVLRVARRLEAFGEWVRGAFVAGVRRAGQLLIDRPRVLLTHAIGLLFALDPRRLRRWLLAWLRPPASASETVDCDVERPDTTTTEGTSFRAAWARFVRLVSPTDPRTMTAGELERAALRRGFRRRPVRTIVKTFREVEYGGSSPTESRIERVKAAVSALREHERADDGERDRP